MSVWVEMSKVVVNLFFILSRSTWACELKYGSSSLLSHGSVVTLHVSVWVEIQRPLKLYDKIWSRSTWACELKSLVSGVFHVLNSHAPRERVSWNLTMLNNWRNERSHAPRERVSWNDFLKGVVTDSGVTLHVSVWVEIKIEVTINFIVPRHAPRERVSWNLLPVGVFICGASHAPRERVSWNYKLKQTTTKKFGHAPRERVSWNTKCIAIWNSERSHAPRERVSWNF